MENLTVKVEEFEVEIKDLRLKLKAAEESLTTKTVQEEEGRRNLEGKYEETVKNLQLNAEN